MRGPRFTLRQVAIAIAVISVVLAFWVRSPIPLESLVEVSLPVALGFLMASLVRHEVERMSGCSMRSPRTLLILIGAGIGSATLAVAILIGKSFSADTQNLQLVLVYSIPALLGFVIYQVSQGSLRFRLTLEIVTIVVLLALSGWKWRPSLRPYRGLDETAYRDLAACIDAVSDHLQHSGMLDRDVINSLWGICPFARGWALAEDGMLRRNKLINPADQEKVDGWITSISHRIAMWLDGNAP
jgi:hypothetical protein